MATMKVSPVSHLTSSLSPSTMPFISLALFFILLSPIEKADIPIF